MAMDVSRYARDLSSAEFRIGGVINDEPVVTMRQSANTWANVHSEIMKSQAPARGHFIQEEHLYELLSRDNAIYGTFLLTEQT